jgi:hypothetical protein
MRQLEPSPAVCCIPDVCTLEWKSLSAQWLSQLRQIDPFAKDLQLEEERRTAQSRGAAYLKHISIIFIQMSNDAIYLLQFLHKFCWIMMLNVSMPHWPAILTLIQTFLVSINGLPSTAKRVFATLWQ